MVMCSSARLPFVIADDKASGLFLNGPGRREAARAHLLVVGSFSGSDLCALGQFVVRLVDPVPDRSSCCVLHTQQSCAFPRPSGANDRGHRPDDAASAAACCQAWAVRIKHNKRIGGANTNRICGEGTTPCLHHLLSG